jgi:uncharacterized protein YecE (DUF72 family)
MSAVRRLVVARTGYEVVRNGYCGHFGLAVRRLAWAVLPAVELNNSFYRLPERAAFTRWRDMTPDDFRVVVKASRYLTHIRRLREPAEPVARLLERSDGLGAKRGPILVQLPPTLRRDLGALDGVLAAFPREVPVAVEPRHRSWWTPEVADVLRHHGATLCWADRGGRPVTPLWRTADFGYLRLHTGRAHPRPRYGTAALEHWLARIEAAYGDGPDVYVFFNNDPGGAAVADAEALAGLADRRGLAILRW